MRWYSYHFIGPTSPEHKTFGLGSYSDARLTSAVLETCKYEDWGNVAKKGTTVDSGEIREVDYSQGDLTGAEDHK